MQMSELEIYAKSRLLTSITAIHRKNSDTYEIEVVVSMNGKPSTHTLFTARKSVRKFKSLDTLARLVQSLPLDQHPLIFIRQES